MCVCAMHKNHGGQARRLPFWGSDNESVTLCIGRLLNVQVLPNGIERRRRRGRGVDVVELGDSNNRCFLLINHHHHHFLYISLFLTAIEAVCFLSSCP